MKKHPSDVPFCVAVAPEDPASLDKKRKKENQFIPYYFLPCNGPLLPGTICKRQNIIQRCKTHM